MFAIDIDRERRVLQIRVAGFFTQTEATEYIDTIRKKFVSGIGCRGFVTQLDIREFPLQSQQVVEALRDHIERFPKATRIAIICGRSPAKMQMRRLLSRDYVRYFETPMEAEAWMFGDGMMRTAA